jgi:hypothetical protein
MGRGSGEEGSAGRWGFGVRDAAAASLVGNGEGARPRTHRPVEVEGRGNGLGDGAHRHRASMANGGTVIAPAAVAAIGG